MDFQEYQKRASTTAIYPSLGQLVAQKMDKVDSITAPTYNRICQAVSTNPYYPALGLAGEVGEFCNKLKKVMRDKGGEIDEDFRQTAKGELGDVLWYLSECAGSLGLSLNEIAEENIEKLFSRKERGTLQGDGDNR